MDKIITNIGVAAKKPNKRGSGCFGISKFIGFSNSAKSLSDLFSYLSFGNIYMLVMINKKADLFKVGHEQNQNNNERQ